ALDSVARAADPRQRCRDRGAPATGKSADRRGHTRGTVIAVTGDMRSLLIGILVAAMAGCAHVTTPPPTEMVEVASPTPVPPSSLEAKPTPKRAALVPPGLVVGTVGLVLTGAAAGIILAPRSTSSSGWDDFGDSLGRAMVSVPLLVIGVPHLAAGLTL